MSQMIFKQVNSKFSKQSWEPHQDNSYILNKKGEYITINIFMIRAIWRMEPCMFGKIINMEFLITK